MENLICISTKEKITNQTGTARFMCPNCGKYEIIRTIHARRIVAKYECPLCNFRGPN